MSKTVALKPHRHHHIPTLAELEKAILHFCGHFAMPLIATALAVTTAMLVPPDSQYIDYFDFKTLACLFATLAVVCALRNIHFFTFMARKIVELTGTARSAVLAVLYITFIGSMLIANDMALLTFLPLSFGVLCATGQEKYLPFTFIMQNISANLGGMLTPFGNPQNLYLYEKFHIPTGEFTAIMLPPFLVAVALITLSVLFVKPVKLTLEEQTPDPLPKGKTALYLLLFLVSVLTVFRVIDYRLCLVLVVLGILFLDRKALLQVDYGLLLTFCAFFVFAGNLARIDAVEQLLSSLLAKNPLVVSSLSCQFISNVPSAILLSAFTEDYRSLLWGVNIGGTGTLIASLASLITFRTYTSHYKGKTLSFLGLFSLISFAFFGILLTFCLVIQ